MSYVVIEDLYIMMLGSKGQKAVRACMIRRLNLGSSKQMKKDEKRYCWFIAIVSKSYPNLSEKMNFNYVNY